MLAFHNGNTIFTKNKKGQEIFLTNMFAYLDIHNSSVLDVYMDDIYDMICKIHRLHLEKYFIIMI